MIPMTSEWRLRKFFASIWYFSLWVSITCAKKPSEQESPGIFALLRLKLVIPTDINHTSVFTCIHSNCSADNTIANGWVSPFARSQD